MKQGRRGAGEAKPEMLQKVFKQGFMQRKGLVFACTSASGTDTRQTHARAGFISHQLAQLLSDTFWIIKQTPRSMTKVSF